MSAEDELSARRLERQGVDPADLAEVEATLPGLLDAGYVKMHGDGTDRANITVEGLQALRSLLALAQLNRGRPDWPVLDVPDDEVFDFAFEAGIAIVNEWLKVAR